MTREQIREDVRNWLNEIENKINEKVDTSVPENILGKIAELSPLLALSSQTVALAERAYNERVGELCLMKEYRNLQATEKKMLFASLASEEQYLCTLADRLNSALVHGLDAYRSAISYLKQELMDSKFNQPLT